MEGSGEYTRSYSLKHSKVDLRCQAQALSFVEVLEKTMDGWNGE
jgi:hypothetical protein